MLRTSVSTMIHLCNFIRVSNSAENPFKIHSSELDKGFAIEIYKI